MSRRLTLTLALGVLVAAACSPHKVTHNPAAPVATPESYAGESSQRPPPEKWWTEFGDPELDALVDRALAKNLQVRAAWSRLKQARALARQASSGQWPQIEGKFDASRQKLRSPLADLDGAPPGTPTTFEVDRFSASIGAGYEIDLWKKMSSQARGAALDARAARLQIEAMAMSMAAEIAEAYFDLAAQRGQQEILDRQIEVNGTFLELVELRFQNGLATALDVYQQRQQVAATRAQKPLVDASVALLSHRLAVLVGEAPKTSVGAKRKTLPELPELPGAGIPADLLERRPDVWAARLRVESADYRVAVAVADRLPSFRISGSVGVQENTIAGLWQAPLWSLFGSILAPLFDGGRRSAQVQLNKAVVEERLFDYGQVLLQAITEVENAMVQERQQKLHLEALSEQVELADATLREARDRYREGLSAQGFLQVLTALQSQQQVELRMLQAERQLISYRIQLCRALGGTWTAELEAPGGPTLESRR